jgi:hypothetical protein
MKTMVVIIILTVIGFFIALAIQFENKAEKYRQALIKRHEDYSELQKMYHDLEWKFSKLDSLYVKTYLASVKKKPIKRARIGAEISGGATK